MIRTLRRIASIGIVSEPPPPTDESLRVREALQQRIRSLLGRALCIRQVDAGSCNGCELEIHALNNPLYNIEGLGIRFDNFSRFGGFGHVERSFTRIGGSTCSSLSKKHAHSMPRKEGEKGGSSLNLEAASVHCGESPP